MKKEKKVYEKYTYEKVKKIFEDKGYILLSEEYYNYSGKLEYICTCGEKSLTSIEYILKGIISCKKCNKNIKRYTYEEVTKKFSDRGYVLLDKKYNNKYTEKLKYICSCGEKSEISLKYLLKGVISCKNCYNKNVKYTYEEVEQLFKNKNYILLTKEYKNLKQSLDYICSCKKKCKTIFEHFLNDVISCKDCLKEKYIKKYGTEIPMQSPIVFEKSIKNHFKTKTYILPSGEIINYQGYELFAIKILLEKYKENDIYIGDPINIPIINYIYNNKKHVFYPDIYIKSENKIIEVKSVWTFEQHKKLNLAKISYSKDLNVEFWIFDKHGKILEIIESKNYKYPDFFEDDQYLLPCLFGFNF